MADQFLTREVSRRDFNAASLTALFVGMTVWVGACGKSGSGSSTYTASPAAPTPTSTPSTPAPAATPDKVGSIADNHGHAATVTAVQLQAAGGVSLSIRGTADHDHSVDLTSAQVAQVAAGTRVTQSSTTSLGGSDGYGGYSTPNHNHSVTFN
jgi:hypothetical protein